MPFLPLFTTLTLILASPAFAGGELEEGELERLTHECNKKKNGYACTSLAGETLCGRGYNEETSALMHQACTNHKNNCSKGDFSACRGMAMCMLACGDEGMEVAGVFIYGEHQMGCHLSSPPNDTLTLLNEATKLAKKACDTQDPEGCSLLGALHATSQLNAMSKAKQAWQQACELNSVWSCAKLSDQLLQEAKASAQRACELGDTTYCAPPKSSAE